MNQETLRTLVACEGLILELRKNVLNPVAVQDILQSGTTTRTLLRVRSEINRGVNENDKSAPPLPTV